MQVIELKEVLQNVEALMPCSCKSVAFRSAGGQAVRRSNAPISGTVLDGLPSCPASIHRAVDTDGASSRRGGKSTLNTGEGDQSLDCGYFGQEPASPDVDGRVSLSDHPQTPVVQSSAIVGHQASLQLELPLVGRFGGTSSTHVVMRTLECKPHRRGIMGTAQLRLKEMYQTIDYKGNAQSQCGYRYGWIRWILWCLLCVDTQTFRTVQGCTQDGPFRCWRRNT